MSVSTREAYGRALVELGAERSDVVVFDADLTTCTMTTYFAHAFPERFFNSGIAEANMTAMAAGMATTGKTVFTNTFAIFATGRAYDQVRNSIAYPGLNVKVVGTHAGISVGEDGPTHQALEDIALMRAIPGITVVIPSDENETRAAVRAIAGRPGPCYLRLGRVKVEAVTTAIPGYTFELGKAVLARPGSDATIIACGLMLQAALEAAETLASSGIDVRVLDMHTIKPLDRDAVLQAAVETAVIVTAEEHNIVGGLGGAVSEVVAEAGIGTRVLRVGTADCFGHSGPADALLKAFGLSADAIARRVREALA